MTKPVESKSSIASWIQPVVSRFFYSVAFRAIPRNLKFKLIHRFNLWSSEESVSGPGSELANTVAIRDFLEHFIRDAEITSILDVPCGDVNWMSQVDLKAVRYLGGDIIPELIRENSARYASDNIRFELIDITADSLPTVDLVIVRDLFIHFSPENVRRSLDSIYRSGSKYLLTTTWPDSSENRRIRDGYNYNINLQIAPYNFPEPLVLVEESRDANSHRNCMGLWKISTILGEG